MTIRTLAAAARFALPSDERPVGVNPPLDYPAYRSAALRAPRQPPLAAPEPGPSGAPGALRFGIRLQGDHETSSSMSERPPAGEEQSRAASCAEHPPDRS